MSKPTSIPRTRIENRAAIMARHLEHVPCDRDAAAYARFIGTASVQSGSALAMLLDGALDVPTLDMSATLNLWGAK